MINFDGASLELNPRSGQYLKRRAGLVDVGYGI